mmetsp:Transcript_22088/g.47995  ORF Transcript_22088/g.47995 Transcript_22088/m.47995 type:complete len:234 (-) Transcript_22088:36-737(-)
MANASWHAHCVGRDEPLPLHFAVHRTHALRCRPPVQLEQYRYQRRVRDHVRLDRSYHGSGAPPGRVLLPRIIALCRRRRRGDTNAPSKQFQRQLELVAAAARVEEGVERHDVGVGYAVKRLGGEFDVVRAAVRGDQRRGDFVVGQQYPPGICVLYYTALIVVISNSGIAPLHFRLGLQMLHQFPGLPTSRGIASSQPVHHQRHRHGIGLNIEFLHLSQHRQNLHHVRRVRRLP